MHKDIIALLKRMGLKDRESRIYLACLRHRDGLFIYEIAKETRIMRSTVDLTVRRLLQRGFLNQVKVGRRLRFFAEAPEAVLFRQKQLVEDLEQVVPMLAKIGGEKKEMEILYFEGGAGFRQVHNDILLQAKFATELKKEVLGFSSGADSIRLFPDMQKNYINKRVRSGIRYKAIAPQSSVGVREWSNDEKALRSVKYLPDDSWQFRIETQIYADNVMLYSPSQPVGGVIIRNEKIADSMRALFKLVWDLLPDKAN